MNIFQLFFNGRGHMSPGNLLSISALKLVKGHFLLITCIHVYLHGELIEVYWRKYILSDMLGRKINVRMN